MGRGGRYVELDWAPDFARPSGRRVSAGRYSAFIPSPIADEDFELTGPSAELAQRASKAVNDLNSSQGQMVSLEGMARQLLRSEALASSQIEGLSVSHRKLAEAELEGRQGRHEAQEIMANVHALERAMEMAERVEELSVDDICAIHAELAIVPPIDKIAGQLREGASWIGGTAPLDAEYVGPPHEHVRPLLEDLCEFMARDDLPAVQQAAIAHSQFELIHPFGDGNGRVGRCLIHVLLRRRGLAPRYVPPVSLVLGANKDAYIAGLERFRSNDVDFWTDQFSRSMSIAAEKASEFSKDVLQLQEQWREKVQARSQSAILPIIELLPQYPILTAAVAEKQVGRSRPATINALERLAEADVVTRHRNQKKGDRWEAKELFRLLDRFEAAVRLPG